MKLAIIGNVLYTYPTYEGNTIKEYSNSFEVKGSKTMEGKVYPTTVLIDGEYETEIRYIETNEKYTVAIEEFSKMKSEWVQSGDALYRLLIHYFHIPLRTKEKEYEVVLTAYKDSDTDFVHYVSIKLPFTTEGVILDNLGTFIKDN